MGLSNPSLDEMREKKDVDGLIRALKHEDTCVRKETASALGSIGDARAVGPLTRALDDKSVFVREAAKESLEKIGAGRADDARPPAASRCNVTRGEGRHIPRGGR